MFVVVVALGSLAFIRRRSRRANAVAGVDMLEHQPA
jgi:hypothetical protein